MRRIRRYLVRLVLGIFSLALLAFIAARTPWVHSWVKDLLESAVTNSINGSLTIERLGGNLFGDLWLEGVVLRAQEDTLGRIGRLRVRFGVLALLSSEAAIEELTVEEVDLRITKNAEGEWITSRIAKPSAAEPEPSKPFPWTIRAERIRLTDGSLVIGSDSGAIVVGALGLSGSVVFSEEEKKFAIDTLSFTSVNPDLAVRRLSAQASLEGGALTLSAGAIRTERNALALRGRYDAGGLSELEFTTEPLDLSEIPGIPAGLNAALRPTLGGRAGLEGDSLQFSVSIARPSERVECSGRIGGLGKDWRSDVELVLSGVDLAAWIPKNLPPTDLNGRIIARAAGIDPGRMHGELAVSLSPSMALDRRVESLQASATYKGGWVSALLDLRGEFGSGRLQGTVDDIRSVSAYELSVSAEELDLAVPLSNSELASRLSVDARVRGRGLDLRRSSADVEAFVRGTAPKGFEVDSCALSGKLSEGQFQIEKFRLVGPDLAASISGRFALDGTLEGEGSLELVNPGPFLVLAGFEPAVMGSGPLHVTAKGSVDSIAGVVDLSLGDVLVSPVRADSVRGTVEVLVQNGEVEVSGRLAAGGFEVEGLGAESVRFDGSYGANRLQGKGAVVFSEDLAAEVQASARFGDTILIEMPSLTADLGGVAWANAAGPVSLRVSGGRVSLSNFGMRSGEQALSAWGTFDAEDSLDLALTMEATEVAPFFRLADVPAAVSGRTNLRLTASGPAANPRITAAVQARDVVLGSQRAGSIALNAGSSDGRVAWELSLVDPTGNEVRSSGYAPVAVTAQGAKVDRDSALLARFETQGYDLAWISSLRHELEHVAGSLSAEVEIAGPLARPGISGALSIRGGELRAPALGLDVRDLTLAVRGEGPRLRLDSLGATVGRGRLGISGEAHLAFGDTLGLLDSLALSVTGSGLSAAVPRRFEVQADAGLRAAYGGRALTYEGRIIIPEARIFLPGLATRFTPVKRPTGRPLLVQATMPLDSAQKAPSDSARARRGLPVMGDRTSGRLNVSIPKNTWIQSPNINIELYGDLVAFQTDTLLELEGTLRISRGTVQFVGKRFQVRTGKAEFFRGPTINPAFSIELDYRFRDANRQDRSLTARLSGTAEAPIVTFALEEKLLTQQDAISYLLFGRSVDELTLNQQSSVSSGDDNMAAAMAFDMLGAQLSNVIAQRAGLDVVEIKSTGGAKSGTLTAGKYVAEGVFISYEKGFGEYGANEPIPEVFTIEYELIRSFFIQLVQANDPRSGFDLIYKIR